jgi:hypothetical protein
MMISCFLAGILLAMFTLICYGLWSRVKEEVTQEEDYRFSPERIYITELPDWVPTTLVHDVLTNAPLKDRQSVITPNLLSDLASAFSAHPWVDEVVRVKMEYPATIHVDLKYREAVCVVKLPENASSATETADQFYPVDGKGTYLPTDYFLQHPDSLNRFIVIENVKSLPIRAVGHRWGDPAVEQGAEIASLLRDVNHLLRIETVRPEKIVAHRSLRIVYRLRTSGKTEIDWGEHADETSERAKLKTLLDMARSYGTLDHVPASEKPIDLSKTSAE